MNNSNQSEDLSKEEKLAAAKRRLKEFKKSSTVNKTVNITVNKAMIIKLLK
jgi:hypothetical protein